MINNTLLYLQLNQPQQQRAFSAGVVSVSLLWMLTSIWRRHKIINCAYEYSEITNQNNDNTDVNDDDNDDSGEREEHDKNYDRTQSTAEAALKIMGNMTSRLSILPNKIKETRERWRWESLRLGNSASSDIEASSNYNQDEDNIDDEDYLDDNDGIGAMKNNTCIGSIFGFDVGGTLSKLLYFEEKPEEPIKKHSIHTSNQLKSKSLSQVSTVKLLNNLQNVLTNDNAHHEYKDKNNQFIDPQFLDVPTKASKSADDNSPLELTSKEEERQQALERFYAFVKDLDSSHGDNLKDKSRSFYSRTLGGQFHFIQFESRHFLQVMNLMKSSNIHLDITKIGATGGGAHKYAERWDKQLGIKIDKQDELESLVAGMQFTLSDVIGECYTFSPRDMERLESKLSECSSISTTSVSGSDCITIDESPCHNSAEYGSHTEPHEDFPKVTDHEEGRKTKKIHGLDQYWWSRKVKRDFIIDKNSYPYLLVMIGTGVSVVRVDGPRQHERISGSTIGGGTYWGLCRLLTDAESFESVLALAERGDPRKVDMMVGDIYGNNNDALEKLGLTADIVASSFGKLVAKKHPAEGLTQEDLARALLLMVTNNIGQVAYLNAKLHNTNRIFFVGNFLRQNVLSQKRLSYAINFWSKGKMEALFLEHEGYFGALGAYLLHNNISHPHKNNSVKDSPTKDEKRPGFLNSKRADSFYI